MSGFNTPVVTKLPNTDVEPSHTMFRSIRGGSILRRPLQHPETRRDIVWRTDPEPSRTTAIHEETILGASLVIVIGSSLTVYPLAGFVEEYADQHGHLIIINKGPTALDNMARARLDAENTGELLDEIYQRIAGKEGERDAERD